MYRVIYSRFYFENEISSKGNRKTKEQLKEKEKKRIEGKKGKIKSTVRGRDLNARKIEVGRREVEGKKGI